MGRGLLKFKGNFQNKLNIEKKVVQAKNDKQKDKTEGYYQVIPDVEKKFQKKKIEHLPVPGFGRVLSSGPVVMGRDTKFKSEVKSGDVIVVLVDAMNFIKESRTVLRVVSDVNMSINKPFSKDVITWSQYDIKKRDEEEEDVSTIDQQFSEKIRNIKDLEPEKEFIEIREKTGMWGYKTKKIEIDPKMSIEERIRLKEKYKKDKSQWN